MLENVVAYMERIVFQKLNVIRNTVQLWFKKDDITIILCETWTANIKVGCQILEMDVYYLSNIICNGDK